MFLQEESLGLRPQGGAILGSAQLMVVGPGGWSLLAGSGETHKPNSKPTS